jgi:hypothetical protein
MFSFPMERVLALLAQGAEDAQAHGGYQWGEKPGLLIVGDTGVYLVSNARFPDGGRPSPPVWSEECDPRRGGDWFSYKVEHFGADDFVALIVAQDIYKLSAECLDASWFRMQLTEHTMRYEAAN